LLLDNMSDGYRSMWEKLGDAASIWKTVEAYFKNAAEIERTKVSNLLETIRLDEKASADNMEAHLSAFNLLCQRAEWAGVARTSAQKVEYWVNSLPPVMMSYKYHIKTYLMQATGEDEWSYASSQFVSVIQDHRRYRKDAEAPTGSALVASGPPPKSGGRGGGRGNGRGGSPGGRGGQARGSSRGGKRGRGRGGASVSTGQEGRTCYTCGGPGHLARNCPHAEAVRAMLSAQGHLGVGHTAAAAVVTAQETKSSSPGWGSFALAAVVNGEVNSVATACHGLNHDTVGFSRHGAPT
jgi:hypothetical protein